MGNSDPQTAENSDMGLHLSGCGIIDGAEHANREYMERKLEVRFEDDEKVVFADTSGLQWDEYIARFLDTGQPLSRFLATMNRLGREHTPNDGIDHWEKAYPLVFDKKGNGFGGEA